MAEIQAIYQAMARMAPPELAESWDNVGLLVDCGRPAARALTALDITPEVVEEARQLGCGVIVAHHPVIFLPPQAAGLPGRGLPAGAGGAFRPSVCTPIWTPPRAG